MLGGGLLFMELTRATKKAGDVHVDLLLAGFHRGGF
jgi:hypothetical protein